MKTREAAHRVFAIGGGALAFIVMLAAAPGFADALAFTALPTNTATVLLVVIGVAILVAHAAVDLRYPKRTKSSRERLALPIVLLGAILFASPEIIRSASQWPSNGDCTPPVVGPGDIVKTYMPVTASSLNGDWAGQANATATTPTSPTAIEIQANAPGRGENWKRGSEFAPSMASTSSVTPWVELTVPTSMQRGQSVAFSIDLDLSYPSVQGGSFQVAGDHLHKDLNLRLGSQSAGRTYTTCWWLGTLLGLVLSFMGGMILTGADKKRISASV